MYELTIVNENDVPEAVEEDPFEDAITNEIVLLDLMRVDPADVELL